MPPPPPVNTLVPDVGSVHAFLAEDGAVGVITRPPAGD